MASSVGQSNVKTKVHATARRNRVLLVTALALVAVIAVGVALLVVGSWAQHPKSVATEVIIPGPASRILAVNGRVAAVTDVQLGVTVAGQVKTVGVREGDQVSAGQVLATLDASQQQAATAQAESQLAASQAELQQAQANYDRAKGLGDSISQKDLQTAQVSLQTAGNDVDRLTAAVNQAKSLLAAYTVTAPFAATVLSRGIDPGQVVSPSTVLFEVADLDHLEVDATVDELYAGDVHRGLSVRLRPAGSNRSIDAEVTFVAPTVDSTSGGRLVRIGLRAGDAANLPIGLTVDTNIVVDRREDAITVPRAALLDPQTKPGVLLVVGGKAVRTPVEYVDWPAGRLIVTSGLSKGDILITDPGDISAGDAVAPKGG